MLSGAGRVHSSWVQTGPGKVQERAEGQVSKFVALSMKTHI